MVRRRGRTAEAEQAYRAHLRQWPDEVEALVQLATVAVVYPSKVDGYYNLESAEKLEVNQEMASGDRLFLTGTIQKLEDGRYRVEGDAELAGENFVRAVFDLQKMAG